MAALDAFHIRYFLSTNVVLTPYYCYTSSPIHLHQLWDWEWGWRRVEVSIPIGFHLPTVFKTGLRAVWVHPAYMFTLFKILCELNYETLTFRRLHGYIVYWSDYRAVIHIKLSHTCSLARSRGREPHGFHHASLSRGASDLLNLLRIFEI